MTKITLLVMITFAIYLPAWGIGRSGNGTISSSISGFMAKTPFGFGPVESEGDVSERLRLVSWITDLRPGMHGRAFLELGEVDRTLPLLAGLGRDGVRAKAASLGWELKVLRDPCVDAYLKHSPDGDLLVAIWGVGKGAVAIGPHSPYVRQGQRELLETLELSPGACAW